MIQTNSILRCIDGKHLAHDAQVLNFLIFSFLLVQNVYYPLLHGAFLIDQAFMLFLMTLFAVLSLLGAIYHKLQPVSVLNSFVMFFATLVLDFQCYSL